MKSSASKWAKRLTEPQASALEGSGVTPLTFGDVLIAAADVSEADAADLVRALFESGRIRFSRPDAQADVDRLARLVHPGQRIGPSATSTAGAA